jgi:LDH2 family malate/lactate/ureidoglycolate dehydrogenase
MLIFSVAFLKDYVTKILLALETPSDLAALMADSLVGSSLTGHDSHGVTLLPGYAAAIRAGSIKPAARPTLEPATGMLATLSIDGAFGWGPVAAHFATEQVIARAQQFGVAAAVVRRCHHIGRVGQYGERMAAQNLIGIAMCNSGSGVAPFGGVKPMLGTNPIVIAVPRQGDQPPVLFDGSTSVVAGNKVRVQHDKRQPTPPGWIIDRDGQPTTNPQDFFDGGALLPLGGHKGYALGVMVELLGGILSGTSASFLPDFGATNGVLVMALRPDAFIPLDDYLVQVERACAALKATPSSDPSRPVLLPGEPEQNARRERMANGIPMPEAAWLAMQELAASLGIERL